MFPWPVSRDERARAVFIHFFRDAERVTDKELRPACEERMPPKMCEGWYYALLDGARLKKDHETRTRRAAAYNMAKQI